MSIHAVGFAYFAAKSGDAIVQSVRSKFVPNTDHTVKSDEPLLDVQASAATPLKPGKHIFQLIVTDDSGNDSSAANVTVIVQDQDRPTAVVDLLDGSGARVSTPEVRVPFGKPFRLTGDRSSDVGGVVKTWNWTLLS